jgi:hypothetical protein
MCCQEHIKAMICGRIIRKLRKHIKGAQEWWHIPVIPASREASIRRIAI